MKRRSTKSVKRRSAAKKRGVLAKIGSRTPSLVAHKTHLPWWALLGVAAAIAVLAAPAYFYWFGDFSAAQSLNIEIERRTLGGADELVPLSENTAAIKPVIYLNAPDLKELTVADRKRSFIAMMLPGILIAKAQTENNLTIAAAINQKRYPSRVERKFMRDLYAIYGTDSFDELSRRLAPQPVSIVLAQAALESGWGTSHTFLQTNNLFGIWSFKESEPRHHAQTRKGGKKVFVRKYESMFDSIYDYLRVIAVSRVFEDFRRSRAEKAEPIELIEHLLYYSEQRGEYIDKLRYVIEGNNLTQYDDYKIDPAYFNMKAAQ